MGGMQSSKNPSWEMSGMKFKFRSFRNIFPSLKSIKLCGRQATLSPFGHLEPAVKKKLCVVNFLQTLFSFLFSLKKNWKRFDFHKLRQLTSFSPFYFRATTMGPPWRHFGPLAYSFACSVSVCSSACDRRPPCNENQRLGLGSNKNEISHSHKRGPRSRAPIRGRILLESAQTIFTAARVRVRMQQVKVHRQFAGFGQNACQRTVRGHFRRLDRV
jgi:hypothetical protein